MIKNSDLNIMMSVKQLADNTYGVMIRFECLMTMGRISIGQFTPSAKGRYSFLNRPTSHQSRSVSGLEAQVQEGVGVLDQCVESLRRTRYWGAVLTGRHRTAGKRGEDRAIGEPKSFGKPHSPPPHYAAPQMPQPSGRPPGSFQSANRFTAATPPHRFMFDVRWLTSIVHELA